MTWYGQSLHVLGMGNNGSTPQVFEPVADQADQQHMAWLARSFGRADYVPLSSSDFESLAGVAEVVSKYPGAHLFREGAEASAVYLVEIWPRRGIPR